VDKANRDLRDAGIRDYVREAAGKNGIVKVVKEVARLSNLKVTLAVFVGVCPT